MRACLSGLNNEGINIIMNEDMTESSALKSPWVWGWIGMIVLVLMANVTMIYFARSTSPGLVVDDYYEKGKNYDKTLEDRQQEKRLGWKINPELPEKITVNESFPLAFSVALRDGENTFPNEATLYLFRPSDASADFSLPMLSKGEGAFAAELVFPLPGVWDVIFSMSRGDENKESFLRVFVEKSSQL